MRKYYYTIGEVSELLEVKPHVLRYWESEIPVIRPKKSGRNRRYTLEQIEMLKKIKYMLYTQRFTIEGVRQKLRQDKSLLAEARLEAAAKNRLKLSAAMPAIASELMEIRQNLLEIKKKCEKITGNK